jgi:hypothetical protein
MFDALVAFVCDHAWSIFDAIMCIAIGMGALRSYTVVLEEGGGYGTYGRAISDPTDCARHLPVNRTRFAPAADESADHFVTSAVLTSVGGVPTLPEQADGMGVNSSLADIDESPSQVDPVRARA